MPQFRDQFDAAQTPRAAAYALRLGHAYDNSGSVAESAVYALIDTIIVDRAGTFALDSSDRFIYARP